jgi:hypothetical protein
MTPNTSRNKILQNILAFIIMSSPGMLEIAGYTDFLHLYDSNGTPLYSLVVILGVFYVVFCALMCFTLHRRQTKLRESLQERDEAISRFYESVQVDKKDFA